MSTPTQSLTGPFIADPVHSSFQFAVTHMSVARYRATFDDVDARVLAGAAGVQLEGRARVGSVSITAPHFRQHVVNGEDFFDAPHHPEITFTSAAIDLNDDGTAAVTGELTIRGIARTVTATGTFQPPVEDPFGNLRAALELRAVVDRRDWGLTWQQPLPGGGDALGWDVELTVHLALLQRSGA